MHMHTWAEHEHDGLAKRWEVNPANKDKDFCRLDPRHPNTNVHNKLPECAETDVEWAAEVGHLSMGQENNNRNI